VDLVAESVQVAGQLLGEGADAALQRRVFAGDKADAQLSAAAG
jgi:hypothetical protein